MPGDLAGLWDQLDSRGRQGRHVQGLTDVAGRVRSTGVLVQEGSAGGEVQ